MFSSLDTDEYGQSKTEAIGIEDSSPPLDDSFTLQPVDSLPAGRSRQTNPPRDIGSRKATVKLQDFQYPAVHVVHSHNPYFKTA